MTSSPPPSPPRHSRSVDAPPSSTVFRIPLPRLHFGTPSSPTSTSTSLNSSLLLLLLLLLLACSSSSPPRVAAHSFLTYPEPYTRCDNKGRHICPALMHNKDRNCVKKRTSPNRPAATWRRGQRVVLKWARNNHNGGFINLALVPVTRMFDVSSIRRLTFYYGCWEQGKHPCRGDQCGSDLSRRAFRRRIVVPAVIPDGDYVVVFLWYGGVDQPRESAQFGDYISCSYVKIKGGKKLRKRPYVPFFVPGNPKKERKKRRNCMSYTSKPGACRNGGCFKINAWRRKPWPFNKGRKPAALYPKLYYKHDRRTAICNKEVCCPKECRLCEGFNCGRRVGGHRKCCPSQIKQYAPKCEVAAGAPCVK